MIKRTIEIIISVLFLVNIAFASDIPTYDIGKGTLQLKDFTIGLIVDSSRTMGINKISQIDDVKLVSSRLIITSIDDNYWFVFNIKNTTSETIKRIVGFDEVYMETADMYYQTDTGWYHEQNGLSQPMELRKIKNRCPVFYISLNAGETKTVYLKLHSKFALIVGIFLYDISEFAQEEQVKIMGYWSYFGAALAILIYNIFLLYNIRERVYLYYVIYAFCIIIFTFLYSGYSLYVNSNINLHYSLHASIAIMGAFITLFTKDFLKTKNLSNWVNRVLYFIISVYVILAFLIVIDIYFYQYLVLFGMPSMLFLLFVGVYSLIKKVPLSKFFVIAISGYLIGLFMIAAVNIGLIPFNNITRYGFLIGSFIELAVFSLALGYRIKMLQEEKNIFQNNILDSERLMKKNLEILVQERTEELLIISEELSATNKALSNQIKEKSKTYKNLKKSELALQTLNNSKDKFFSIIAHDLRSPFNSILGFLNILKNDYKNFGEDEKINMINILHDSVHNTYSLLENLLIWSKSQIYKMDYNPIKIETFSIINENILLIQNLANEKNIKLIVNTEQLQYIMADKEMISTVIRNLITNAIKFTHSGGSISIIARPDLHSEGKVGKISIKDSGVGIDSKALENLFLISHSTSTRGTNNEKGTGLGLILCKEFIEMHGGEIWAESELGKGSVFHFTIPLS